MAYNTMVLPRVRFQGSGDYSPATIFLDHVVAVVEAANQVRMIRNGGTELIVDMEMEKFTTRLKLDNPDT
jgi:hypothetical protein